MDHKLIIGIVFQTLGPIIAIITFFVSILQIKKKTKNCKYVFATNISSYTKLSAGLFVAITAMNVGIFYLFFISNKLKPEDEPAKYFMPIMIFLFYFMLFPLVYIFGSSYIYTIDESNTLRCYSAFKKTEFDLNSPFELNMTIDELNYMINLIRFKANKFLRQDGKSFKMFASLFPIADENMKFVEYILNINKLEENPTIEIE